MATGLPAATSFTPGVSTHSTIKKRIARYVQMADKPRALEVADDGIRDAILRINARTWPWMIDSHDITLAADDATYTVPADYKASWHLHRLNSSSVIDGELGYLEPKTFWEVYPKPTSSGSPTAYTVISYVDDLTLTLSVPPTSSFATTYPTLRHRFYGKIAIPSDGSAALIPGEAENFIYWSGASYVATVISPQKAPFAASKAEQAWRDLIRDAVLQHEHDWAERWHK